MQGGGRVVMRRFRSVLVTPNIDGADGVSCLSRQIAGALPEPVMVLSLHDRRQSSPLRQSAGSNRLRFVLAALDVALHCDSDTVIACSHTHLAPAARVAAWRGAQVTNVLCGIEAWVPLRGVEAWALSRGRLLAISAHTARRFREANPRFRDAVIDICHPGLPPGRDAAVPPVPVDAALIVGRMSASEGYKGHEQLLQVWPRVLERRPAATLWVVGDGDDRPRLEQLAASLGIDRSVTFTGRVSDDELVGRYRSCRFFVMPSRDEGFGLVFLEAMRAGKACIGARGAAEEIVRDGVTGLIVDPADADGLTGAILRLFDDRAACDAMGRAGAARFLAEFTDVRFAIRFAQSSRPAFGLRADGAAAGDLT
jgi:glycosyltransferase involved in cell wall biosynthesis